MWNNFRAWLMGSQVRLQMCTAWCHVLVLLKEILKFSISSDKCSEYDLAHLNSSYSFQTRRAVPCYKCNSTDSRNRVFLIMQLFSDSLVSVCGMLPVWSALDSGFQGVSGGHVPYKYICHRSCGQDESEISAVGRDAPWREQRRRRSIFWDSLIWNKYTQWFLKDVETVGTALAGWVHGQRAVRGR